MVFTYICGNLQWSATGSSPDAAVVGYSSAGTQYLNHRLSGYRSIEDSLSCAVRLGKKRKRQTGGNTLVFNVRNVVGKCRGMLLFDQVGRKNLFLEESRLFLEPCPCTVSQAILDTARFRQQSDDTNCFVSMKPVVVATPDDVRGSSESLIYQQCCYIDG